MSLFSNKIVLITLIGILVGGIVWYSFMRDRSSAPLLQTNDLTQKGAVDSDVVETLLQLRAVSLAGTIFTDPAFISLQDFSRQIVDEPKGRANPFAPFSSASSSAPAKPTGR